MESCYQEEDDKRRLVKNSSLPLDLVLCIITLLPSRQLFDFRRLCKAAHPHALLALARRPFFVLQKELPASLCYLLPLDPPCSPLPCSVNLAKPYFRLLFASGNLLCLQRRYNLLLDVCVCSIFRKWKIIIPPIVHPSLAPRLSRRVFLEDSNVEFLRVVGFHCVQPTIDTQDEEHAHGVFSPRYLIFVSSETYLRVFDSHLNQWSGPVKFPPHLCFQFTGNFPSHRDRVHECFTTSDGNLILTFSSKGRRGLFKYEDQSFHAMELPFHPQFEVAGYPAMADIDLSFNLRVWLPHVEECVCSSPERGLVLKGLCKSDVDTPYADCSRVSMRGMSHRHGYSRRLLRKFCHAYQGKVYALVMERDEMCCSVEDSKSIEQLLSEAYHARQELNDSESADRLRHELKSKLDDLIPSQWHDLPSEDLEKYLHPDKDADFDCDRIFPACSSSKLSLYSACIDTTNWTMKVSKEADATTFLDIFNDMRGTIVMSV